MHFSCLKKSWKLMKNEWLFNVFFMFFSLLFRACFWKFCLLLFDYFPNCAKPKNIENPLVLIHYFALGTFRKRTKNKKNMQKLKQFWHWIFIKNHDFFWFKISMDFWMVFSLKMAYFWRPFSMKKPYKNPCWFWTRKSHDF